MRTARYGKTILLGLCVFASAYSACLAAPDSDIVNFNIGTESYKKGDYQRAQEAFTKALTSDDKAIEADALYDLGNCKYRMGRLKEGSDPSAASNFLRESLEYYKRAVEIDPRNTDARFNHEFVEKELKALRDKLKQQGAGQDKQKGEQKERQQRENSSGSAGERSDSARDKQGKGEKERQQPEQAEGQQQKEGQKEAQGQQRSPEERQEQRQNDQSAKEGSRQEGENKELSEEAARALLERYGSQEGTPDYSDKPAQVDDNQVSKDW